MPVAAALVLTACERHRIKRLARSRTLPHQQVLRAQIVRLAACGGSNASIAAALQLKLDTVRKWRGRFAARGLDGLKDLPRCGRPPRFTALQRAEVKALACALPGDLRRPAVAMDLRRSGRASRLSRDRTVHIGLDGAPDPGPGRDQAVAVPVLDFGA